MIYDKNILKAIYGNSIEKLEYITNNSPTSEIILVLMEDIDYDDRMTYTLINYLLTTYRNDFEVVDRCLFILRYCNAIISNKYLLNNLSIEHIKKSQPEILMCQYDEHKCFDIMYLQTNSEKEESKLRNYLGRGFERIYGDKQHKLLEFNFLFPNKQYLNRLKYLKFWFPDIKFKLNFNVEDSYRVVLKYSESELYGYIKESILFLQEIIKDKNIEGQYDYDFAFTHYVHYNKELYCLNSDLQELTNDKLDGKYSHIYNMALHYCKYIMNKIPVANQIPLELSDDLSNTVETYVGYFTQHLDDYGVSIFNVETMLLIKYKYQINKRTSLFMSKHIQNYTLNKDLCVFDDILINANSCLNYESSEKTLYIFEELEKRNLLKFDSKINKDILSLVKYKRISEDWGDRVYV